MTQYLKRKQKQSGFTLVELLVVIAIIGILTAIGVPMYNGYQASAKVSATKQNFDAMKTFIAGEVTKCSAGLVGALNDPKAGAAIASCPTGLNETSATAYFTGYGKSTIKNPYNTAAVWATDPWVTATNPQTADGVLTIAADTTNHCVLIQTAFKDPTTQQTTAYPSSPDCISVQ